MTYSSLTKELTEYIKSKNIGEIYLCGVDTECCILKMAFDMLKKEILVVKESFDYQVVLFLKK